MTSEHTLTKHILTLSLCALALLAVFTPARAASEVVAYSFAGQPNDGANPYSGLSGDSTDNGYGTTEGGGTYDKGTVYKITQTGHETILHSFGAYTGDGQYPSAGVTLGKDGNFYGTTEDGGTYDEGTVFKITPAGAETVLHSFGASGDGNTSRGALVQAKDGNFYGTTEYGGAYSNAFGGTLGTVFKITPAGAETVLYSFGAYTGDGQYPSAGVTLGKDGNFYGTTEQGGAYSGPYGNAGTVFEITPSGVETVLHSFNFNGVDGYYPEAPLVQDLNGYLYGTTYEGGKYNDGTIFRIIL